MAANPTTGVDPIMDRFAQVLASTGQIVQPNVPWPRDDGEPLSGTQNYKYYKLTDVTPPSAGPQYKVDQIGFTLIDADPAPAPGYPAGNCEPNYQLALRSVAEQKLQVDAYYNRVIRFLFPQTFEPGYFLKAMDAIRAQASGATLTQEQQTLVDDNTQIASEVTQCDARKAALYAAINGGDTYDLTAGWPVTAAQLESALA